jgi:hypothetical protein
LAVVAAVEVVNHRTVLEVVVVEPAQEVFYTEQ